MGSRVRLLSLRHALVAFSMAALALVVALVAAAPSSRADDLGTLRSQLGAANARQSSLAASIGSLDHLIGTLDSQIALVQRREAAVDDTLVTERAQLSRVRGQLVVERARVAMLHRRLDAARQLLAAQLRSGYETDRPSLVTVVLSAHGFQDLLTTLSFLGDAQHAQQRLIAITADSRREAAAAAAKLASLQRTDVRITHGTELEARALAGMNSLLQSKQAALARARGAQAVALAASRAQSRRLSDRISAVEAAQRRAAERAAAARAAAAAQAAAAAAAGSGSGDGSSGAAGGGPGASGAGGAGAGGAAPSGGSGGWAIPEPIVMCESGGQNLPPNSAGASGYYQIIPGTWKLYGGTGPAAWLTPLAEQSAVAARIWNGGAGASNWVCAAIVGIH